MSNIHTFTDGCSIDLDTERPTVTRAQLAELKNNPTVYKLFCEKVNAFNRTRYQARKQDPTFKPKLQAKQKDWRKSESGKEKLAAYMVRYRSKNPDACAWSTARGATWKALFKGENTTTAEENLGCSIAEYRSYLESKFLEGMSWENYGKGVGKWCLDHIEPLAFFDLNNPEDKKRALRWTNTKPIWFHENCIKWHEDKAAGHAPLSSSPSPAPVSHS